MTSDVHRRKKVALDYSNLSRHSILTDSFSYLEQDHDADNAILGFPINGLDISHESISNLNTFASEESIFITNGDSMPNALNNNNNMNNNNIHVDQLSSLLLQYQQNKLSGLQGDAVKSSAPSLLNQFSDLQTVSETSDCNLFNFQQDDATAASNLPSLTGKDYLDCSSWLEDYQAERLFEAAAMLIRSTKVPPRMLAKQYNIPINALFKRLTKGYMKDEHVEVPTEIREQLEAEAKIIAEEEALIRNATSNEVQEPTQSEVSAEPNTHVADISVAADTSVAVDASLPTETSLTIDSILTADASIATESNLAADASLTADASLAAEASMTSGTNIAAATNTISDVCIITMDSKITTNSVIAVNTSVLVDTSVTDTDIVLDTDSASEENSKLILTSPSRYSLRNRSDPAADSLVTTDQENTDDLAEVQNLVIDEQHSEEEGEQGSDNENTKSNKLDATTTRNAKPSNIGEY